MKYACYCSYFANLYDLKLLVTAVPSSATEISSTCDNILQTLDLLEIKHFDCSKSLLLQKSSSRMIFRIKVKTTQLLLFMELLFTVLLCFYSIMYTLMFGFVMGRETVIHTGLLWFIHIL